MTVIDALSSFREPGEMSPHKRSRGLGMPLGSKLLERIVAISDLEASCGLANPSSE
jgi:hypothetical protein